MTAHVEYLELAAAAIDFDLEPSEAEALAAHLADCQACRRNVTGLREDQQTLQRLPRLEANPAVVGHLRSRVRAGRGPRLAGIRLLAVAAALALLALTTLAVGAALVQRSHDRDLTVVTPSVVTAVQESSTPEPTPPHSPKPSTPPSPGPTSASDSLAVGSTVEVVVDGLRVRTAPTVDNSKSAKLDPLLGQGVRLQVIDGPVRADDYDWYLVQAIGLPHRGWIAAADHDGAAWVEDRSAAPASAAALSDAEATLVAGLRDDVRTRCAPRRKDLPTGATAGVECQLNSTSPANRIGAYQFPDPQTAATWYLKRMASYEVQPGTGDCRGGTAGDAAWMPGDGEAGADAITITPTGGGPWVVGRSGCFLDEDGTANVRATCGSTYVGVVGRDADLASVYDWVWRPETATPEAGHPPGLCAAG